MSQPYLMNDGKCDVAIHISELVRVAEGTIALSAEMLATINRAMAENKPSPDGRPWEQWRSIVDGWTRTFCSLVEERSVGTVLALTIDHASVPDSI